MKELQGVEKKKSKKVKRKDQSVEGNDSSTAEQVPLDATKPKPVRMTVEDTLQCIPIVNHNCREAFLSSQQGYV